jgi:hypothetical protein
MIVEVLVARMWRIWIDEETTEGEWEVWHTNDEWPKQITSPAHYSTLRNEEPLQIGIHTIEWIEFDQPEHSWHDGNKPKVGKAKIDGVERGLKLIEVLWANPDTGNPESVRLLNDQRIELDETMAYLRFEVEGH